MKDIRFVFQTLRTPGLFTFSICNGGFTTPLEIGSSLKKIVEESGREFSVAITLHAGRGSISTHFAKVGKGKVAVQ